MIRGGLAFWLLLAFAMPLPSQCQEEQLRRVIPGAVARSPWYRERLGAGAAGRPFESFLVLTKRKMMAIGKLKLIKLHPPRGPT